VRVHAHMIPSEVFRELEAQLLEQARDGTREQMSYLVSESDLTVELLSGEWRVLFDEGQAFGFRVVDEERMVARWIISPDELEEFVEFLRDEGRRRRWGPIAFGLAELVDALPQGSDLVGLVFVEEGDDWQWVAPTHELLALREDVFALLDKPLRKLLAAQRWPLFARLAADHAEGAVEFEERRWVTLLGHAQVKVPELLALIDQRITVPDDYTHVREALALVADPAYQPSLDAWLRVHAEAHRYALVFRDARLERDGKPSAPPPLPELP